MTCACVRPRIAVIVPFAPRPGAGVGDPFVGVGDGLAAATVATSARIARVAPPKAIGSFFIVRLLDRVPGLPGSPNAR
jgi:hypothetical protein